jgi:hypothetical protein
MTPVLHLGGRVGKTIDGGCHDDDRQAEEDLHDRAHREPGVEGFFGSTSAPTNTAGPGLAFRTQACWGAQRLSPAPDAIEPVLAPDAIEPVLGWRFWNAVEQNETWCLASVFFPVVWPAGKALRAACTRRKRFRERFRSTQMREPHIAPLEGCRCGIHALSRNALETLREVGWQPAYPVAGRVSLWGVIHEHEYGWRASLAYPEHLYLPKRAGQRCDAERISAGLERYGAPVELLTVTAAEWFPDAVGELIASHGSGPPSH